MPNVPLSKFDNAQILRKVYEIVDNCLRVCVVNGVSEPIPVTIVDAGAANKVNVLQESNFLDTSLSTSAYVEIFTYTALQNISIKDIKIKADTMGSFSLKVNTVLQDYYQTSEINRNCLFHFNNTMDIVSSDVISIEFRPFRLQIVTNYNFFMRIEASS